MLDSVAGEEQSPAKTMIVPLSASEALKATVLLPFSPGSGRKGRWVDSDTAVDEEEALPTLAEMFSARSSIALGSPSCGENM